MYSPKYFDFYAYDDDQNTAKNKSIQKCKDFSRKKNWDKKIECVYIKANLTLKETNYTQSTQSTSSNSVSFTASIGKHKNTCKELGFKPGTESFANCGLKLIEAEVSYEQAISLNPEHFVAHNNLGFTLATTCFISPNSYLIMNPLPSDQFFRDRVKLQVQVPPPIHLRHRLIM